jgi:endonuclease/exonuclease/phosphatase family metal-dependent hydrolase
LQVATTHLDNTPPFAIQRAQAAEAIGSLTAMPMVFMGDFNVDPRDDSSNPTFPTYQLFKTAGFYDAWQQKNPTLPGYTCCQAADLQQNSALSVRFDLVLTHGAVTVEDIKLVGDQPDDRTQSNPRLWPSDHAGILAVLRIGE